MKFRVLMLGLCAVLAACGESSAPAATAPVQTSNANEVSNDPKYANPLLNVPPEQFNALLGDCAAVLYAAPHPSDVACRKAVVERAAQMQIALQDANLDEPLVYERYQFSIRGQAK